MRNKKDLQGLFLKAYNTHLSLHNVPCCLNVESWYILEVDSYGHILSFMLVLLMCKVSTFK